MDALDFDLACSFRLEVYENETRKALSRMIAYEVSKLFSSDDTDGGIDRPEIW